MTELEHWRDFWGDKGDRPNPYGTRDQRYAEGYHRGEDVANNGSVEFVPVLRAGVIVESGFSPKIGSYVVVKPDETLFRRAEFDGYCHLYGPVMLRSGRVDAGDILSRTAGARENPGSSWGGPHLHFTVTAEPGGVDDIGIVDFNPNPIIDAALEGRFAAAPAGGDEKPLPTPSRGRSKDMHFITFRNAAGARLYVRVGFDDAARETEAEAKAWNAATGERHAEVDRAEAHLILEGVRAARARRLGAIADAVTEELESLLAEIGNTD